MEEVKQVNINVPKRAVVITKYTNPSGGAYFLGFLGAIIYFFQNANGFGEYVIGFIKACLWPGYLVYHLLKFLGVS